MGTLSERTKLTDDVTSRVSSSGQLLNDGPRLFGNLAHDVACGLQLRHETNALSRP